MKKIYKEYGRQIEHIVPAFFIPLLRYLDLWSALVIALLGFFWGAFLSRRIIPETFRPEEKEKGYSVGKIAYALMIILLLIIFHKTMYVVAGAWALLAFGDSFATIFGKSVGKKKLPWNKEKTWVGFFAFVVFGSVAAIFAIYFVKGSAHFPDFVSIIVVSIFISLICAFVESYPLIFNDNFTVPIIAALLMFACFKADFSRIEKANDLYLVLGFGLTLAAGCLAFALRSIDWPALIFGTFMGMFIFWGVGWGGFLGLCLFFTMGFLATRWKYAEKDKEGIAQPRRGRRGLKHALANCAVPTLMAILAILTPAKNAFTIAFFGSLATAVFDTVASEMGKVYGKNSFLIIARKEVSKGTSGAISLEGTCFGLSAAAVIAFIANFTYTIDPELIPLIIVAAFLGAKIESIMSELTPEDIKLKKDILNFFNTLIGGLICFIWTYSLAVY